VRRMLFTMRTFVSRSLLVLLALVLAGPVVGVRVHVEGGGGDCVENCPCVSTDGLPVGGDDVCPLIW
jgi:hypothetical protein